MRRLTELQAYAAMILFLTDYSKETPSLRVGDLLSSMYLVTGDRTFETFDPGYWEDWLSNVESVLRASETDDKWEQFVDEHLLYKLIAPDGTEQRIKLDPNSAHKTEPLSLDDSLQRQLLEETVGDATNLVVTYNDGTSLYARTLSNGTQIWAHVKDGTIIRGGRNESAY